MNKSPPLTEVKRQLVDEPEALLYPVERIAPAFGLTSHQVLVELRTGALRATGVLKADGGFDGASVNGADMIEWLASETPTAQLARRYLQWKKEAGRA